MSEVKRFSDLKTYADDVSQWVKIDDVLNKDIIITDCVFAKGQFGEYMIVKFTDLNSEEIRAFTTGGIVLIDKIKYAKENNLLPLVGKIIKEKRYYDIV